MSHKHLRLYVVVFEDDDFEEALVYAEDLSRNGCHWNGSLMGKKNDAFLLSDGDRLRLTSKTSLVFQAHCPDVCNHFDLVQEREMQVRSLISCHLIRLLPLDLLQQICCYRSPAWLGGVRKCVHGYRADKPHTVGLQSG